MTDNSENNYDEEIIREFVFSWWVITVCFPSASLIKPAEIEFKIYVYKNKLY